MSNRIKLPKSDKNVSVVLVWDLYQLKKVGFSMVRFCPESIIPIIYPKFIFEE
ncbi:MAG: hypothetical protein ACFFB0_09485 [Promethearchaeota archaeon]